MAILEPVAGVSIDGYELIRLIGSGGFGQVWLVRNYVGEFKALKMISGVSTEQRDRELKGLIAYREKAPWTECPHLVPVEHVNGTDQGFFYVMPLADGLYDEISPLDERWKPNTLANWLVSLKESGNWINSEWIRFIVLHVISAASALEIAGLVHRDIKPENILFVQGRLVLADCSLVGADKIELTRRGTPGFTAPAYYTEAGGSPDMYSIGALMYFLLSGRQPDSANLSSRKAYWWPPGGEGSLSPQEKDQWVHLRKVVLTALDEDRHYSTLDIFSQSLVLDVCNDKTIELPTKAPQKYLITLLLIVIILVVSFVSFAMILSHGHSGLTSTGQEIKPPVIPSTSPSSDGEIQGVSDSRRKELKSLCDTFQTNLDALKRKYFVFNSSAIANVHTALEELEKSAADSDADSKLDAFLERYKDFRFGLQNDHDAQDGINQVSSYLSPINKWAVTDQEKVLTDLRLEEFNSEFNDLYALLRDHGSVTADSAFHLLVIKICLKRQKAAVTRREQTNNISEFAADRDKANQYQDKLEGWLKNIEKG